LPSEKLPYANLGCGARYHPRWINLDIDPQGAEVQHADLSKGIPLPSESCKVVYNAAVLEHLRPPDVVALLAECKRVLMPGGILRIGVPDLERIVRLYLESLSGARQGTPGAEDDYDWILLELFDQIVRETSGGRMLQYLNQKPLPNEGFVLGRIGEEGREILEQLRSRPDSQTMPNSIVSSFKNAVVSTPSRMRTNLLRRLLGSDGARALAIGQFRLGGEVHQWMYDSFSLRRTLERAGFVNIRLHGPTSSDIPEWSTFHLDVTPEGRVNKPDLFFAEARKPEFALD
jgi:predicted SAM-dependent methyltransferase